MSGGIERRPSDGPEGDFTPCQVRLKPAPANPGQLAAWRCLWDCLLAEDGEAARQDERTGGQHGD
jgi:hypothetical protein